MKNIREDCRKEDTSGTENNFNARNTISQEDGMYGGSMYIIYCRAYRLFNAAEKRISYNERNVF